MTNKEKKCKKYVGCIEVFPNFYAKTIFNEYGLKISPEEIEGRALLVCPVDDGFFEYCKNVTEDDCIWIPYGADRYYLRAVR